MKKYGRLLSMNACSTPVALTVVTLLVIGGGGGAEIFCKAFVALIIPAVAFSKAFVAFSNVPGRFSNTAAVALVVLVEPPVVIVVPDWLALDADAKPAASLRNYYR
jgi:hypothetical protein